MAADMGGGDRADGHSTILMFTWVATIATVAGTVPVMTGLFDPLDPYVTGRSQLQCWPGSSWWRSPSGAGGAKAR